MKDFSNGFAMVSQGDKWGYIDTTGREVAPCRYDSIGEFSEGFALVKLNGKWGYVYKSGQEVVPCVYDEADSVSCGCAVVKQSGKYGLIVFNDDESAAPAPSTPAPAASGKTAYASTQNVELDGKAVEFQCYALRDANGNATNYIKLRDLGEKLNFNVGWSAERGMFVETGKPYDPAN